MLSKKILENTVVRFCLRIGSISNSRHGFNWEDPAFWNGEFQLLWQPQRNYGSLRDKNFEIESRAEVLSKTFNCDIVEACEFLNHNLQVAKMGRTKYHRMVELFHEQKIPSKEIFTYPEVFKRNCDTLHRRFEQLKEVGVEKVTLAQVNISLPSFNKRLRMYEKEKNARDVYFDTTFMIMSVVGCSRQEAHTLIKRNQILKDSKLSTLQTKIELLVAQGITPRLILKKSWILTQPLEKLETRAKFLRKHGITFQTCPKSYFFLMKCSQDVLEKNVECHKEELSILGDCKTKEEFLCKALNCDSRHIEILLRSYSKLLSVGTAKLHATLTFLKDVGIPSRDIIAHGRIFAFSTETLQQRHRELSDLGCETVTARFLAMDSRVYKKLLNKLKCQIV